MHIVSTPAFRSAAEAIENLCPCPFEGRVTVDQIKVALVEFLDVVPAALFDDVAGDEPSASYCALHEVHAASG